MEDKLIFKPGMPNTITQNTTDFMISKHCLIYLLLSVVSIRSCMNQLVCFLKCNNLTIILKVINHYQDGIFLHTCIYISEEINESTKTNFFGDEKYLGGGM